MRSAVRIRVEAIFALSSFRDIVKPPQAAEPIKQGDYSPSASLVKMKSSFPRFLLCPVRYRSDQESLKP
ncbi:hypothetical protein CBS147322_4714 [Aspergillus niger]|nr:hypothetical protein CBS147322_4714 [Aspergillus niger]